MKEQLRIILLPASVYELIGKIDGLFPFGTIQVKSNNYKFINKKAHF